MEVEWQSRTHSIRKMSIYKIHRRGQELASSQTHQNWAQNLCCLACYLYNTPCYQHLFMTAAREAAAQGWPARLTMRPRDNIRIDSAPNPKPVGNTHRFHGYLILAPSTVVLPNLVVADLENLKTLRSFRLFLRFWPPKPADSS